MRRKEGVWKIKYGLNEEALRDEKMEWERKRGTGRRKEGLGEEKRDREKKKGNG